MKTIKSVYLIREIPVKYLSGYLSEKLVCGKSFEIAQQIICGENCTFVLHANGAVSACGEGSNGRLGLGNSDDYDTLTLLSALRGKNLDIKLKSRSEGQKVNIKFDTRLKGA